MRQAKSQTKSKSFGDKIGFRFGRSRKATPSSDYLVRSDSFMVYSFNNSPSPKQVPNSSEKKQTINNNEIRSNDVTMLQKTIMDMQRKSAIIVEEEEIIPESRILEGELDSTVVRVTKNEDLKYLAKTKKCSKVA